MVLAERIEYCRVGKLATMASAKLPTEDTPGLDFQCRYQIVPGVLELEVGEVPHPGTDVGHALVAHTIIADLADDLSFNIRINWLAFGMAIATREYNNTK
jgi:hypothetical protein